MSKTAKSWVLAVMLSVLPFASQAGAMIFNFSGTINHSGLSDVAVGDVIAGSFAYDPETVPAYFAVGSSGSRRAIYEFELGAGTIEARAGTHDFKADLAIGHVLDNSNGNTGDYFHIGGSWPIAEGGSLREGGILLVLASKPGNHEALHGAQLPVGFDIPAFDAIGFPSSIHTDDGSLLYFQLDAITPIPEPVSGLLAFFGVMTLCAVAGLPGARNSQ